MTEKRRDIILSPHYDDAVLSLGGFLANGASDPIVATVFAGRPLPPVSSKWDQKCGFQNSDEAMTARSLENIKALRELGLTGDRIRDYPHILKSYRPDRGTDERRNALLEQAVVADIGNLVAHIPTEYSVNLYAPSLADHVDHAIVRGALVSVSKDAGLRRRCSFFLYQDLPYVKRFWQENTTDVERVIKEEVEGHIGSKITSTHLLFDEYSLNKKLEAIVLYRSQYAKLADDLRQLVSSFAALQCPSAYCEVVYQL